MVYYNMFYTRLFLLPFRSSVLIKYDKMNIENLLVLVMDKKKILNFKNKYSIYLV